MQLIVETETTIDIAQTMSTVEDIQNNKVESLEINEKKCNRNKNSIEINATSEGEDIKQTNSKNDDDLDNISNIDLSIIIQNQNSPEAKDAQIEESHNHNSKLEGNGLDIIESINESKTVLEEEEEYEDDLISISEIPYNSNPESGNSNFPQNNDETNYKKETLGTVELDEEPTVEKLEEVKDDDIEVIQDKVIQREEETKKSSHKVEDDVELIDDSDCAIVNSDNLIESTVQKGKDADDVVKELEDIVLVQEEELEKIGIRIENNVDTPMETTCSTMEVEKNEIDMTLKEEEMVHDKHMVETEEKNVQCENKTNLVREEDTDSLKKETDQVMIIEKDDMLVSETKDNVIQNEEKTLEDKIEDVIITNDDENPTDKQNKVIPEKSEDKLLDEKDKDQCLEEKEEAKPSEKDKLLEGNGEKNNANTIKIADDKNETPEFLNSSIDHNKVEATNIAMKSTDQSVKESLVTSIKEVPTDEIQAVEKVGTLISEDTYSSAGAKSDVLRTLKASVVVDDKMDVEEAVEEPKAASPSELNNDMDVEAVVEETRQKKDVQTKDVVPNKNIPVKSTVDEPFKLSNTLDILSDDDDELPAAEPSKTASPVPEPSASDSPKESDETAKQCINIEDDDDIMLVDEESNKETAAESDADKKEELSPESGINTESSTNEKTAIESGDLPQSTDEKDTPLPATETETSVDININEKTPEATTDQPDKTLKPLVPDNFAKIAKKKLADMTRDELEEFCILKIVESIVDRSSLSDIKNKLKSMTQGLEEYRRKVKMLTKQHRDLQVVLKSVQEEQKKGQIDIPITPLTITRSVGMQVFMEKTTLRKKPQPNNNNKTPSTPQTRNAQSRQKQPNQQIPVPRLVPATPALKTPSTTPQANQISMQNKNASTPNGAIKNPSPSMKAEKRQFSKVASSSVTVDLTDDEPPAKMPGGPKTSPAPPVRLVSPQSLMAPRQAFGTSVNSPRKVYIPISGPQSQNIRPGQTIMLKPVPAPGIRPRAPTARGDQNTAIRINRTAPRHPAPLPFAMKQYQPPNWKALPPPPDLKLSKVENGIVISWKIDGIPEDSYEEIASYQLFAYQETSIPPSTALWKKIGDVKALPLPMACTLTQFMAGFKYYFAVRAVDIRSRLGPFSLPGSILLLNKNM